MPDNTPKWTPGPWKLWAMQVCSAAPSHGGNQKQMDDSDVVATTYQRDNAGHPITADATLCAAAPELYDALEINARWLREVVRAGWIDPQSTDVLTRIEVQEAALVKANPARQQGASTTPDARTDSPHGFKGGKRG